LAGTSQFHQSRARSDKLPFKRGISDMRIGVVIPLFRQAQFLIECVTSILSQTLMPEGIVIVNDGCPNPSSDILPRAIAAAWPQQTLYLRQENRGLSGARNAGVRALLNRWPEIEAILPLDADDWLEEHSLEAMARRLASEDYCDWVYPDFQRFGSDFNTWKPVQRLNPFRFFFENSCAASSLIRRRVFEAGVFYDEKMRDGYEDWEFFLRAIIRGFWGTPAGNVGFNYRVKRTSMLVEADKKYKHTLQSMHENLHIKPWTLTACEHKYMPRFRFIDDHGRRNDFSDPMHAPAWEHTSDPDYVPPITILGSGTAFELLKRSGTLRGVLFSVQYRVRTDALRIDLKHRKSGLGVELKRDLGDIPALFAIQSTRLADGSISANNILSIASSAQSLVISSPDHSDVAINSNTVDFEFLFRHAGALPGSEAETAAGLLESRQMSNTWFAREHHLVCGETTYPLIRDGEIDICFVVPWLRLGGVDQCVLKCAEALKRSVKSVRLHLLFTDFRVVDFDRAELLAFDEIVSVAHCEHDERLQLLSRMLSSMDIVINANSLQGYQALPLLPKRSRAVHRPMCISYLQANEEEPNGRLFGYPYIACEYENEVDYFLVVSEQLRDFLINSGVNEERIRIGRNAPAVQPATREQALLLADRKATRQCCAGGHLKLLFAGRLDFQKGLSRLASFVQLADREGINLSLTIVGSATLAGETVDWPANRVRLVEATRDPTTLARHFEDADAFILLSRWEGVPLALLDAMAHGCIVVATSVGAVGELVVDGINGFLCPSSGGDDVVARAALDHVKTVLADPSGCREMRRRATETAMDFTWDKVAANLEEFLVV
jgi:glycosyltransferase involved in cell wall biosynthesis